MSSGSSTRAVIGRAKISARMVLATWQRSLAPDLSRACGKPLPSTVRLKTGAHKPQSKSHAARAEFFALPAPSRRHVLLMAGSGPTFLHEPLFA